MSRKLLLAIFVVILATAVIFGLSGQKKSPELKNIPLKMDSSLLLNQRGDSVESEVGTPISTSHKSEYIIGKGDTLSSIFSNFSISQQQMYQVLEADLNVLALDTLQPGNKLILTIDKGVLTTLELYFNAADQVVFNRVSETHFEYQVINKKGQWFSQPLAATITDNFYNSARRAKITSSEIYLIQSLLKKKINFSRDFRKGDHVEIVRKTQYIHGVATGNSEVTAVRIQNRKRVLSVYLASDGNYYDQKGQSLLQAFSRYPTKKHYRISSPFNPKRRHPVTGRISPHNGVDFATPVGTPIYATGDGVVTLIRNHRYAGKYIVIQNSNKYKTRYLHLSKFLVKKGQRVSRGQKIALSGATGRITGPHLHYEFIINNRPVNPMTAKIPMASSVKNKKSYNTLIKKRNGMMDLLI
ncbi:peptidoglycan DD-metalloendopeptidase family protein [Vibrio sp. SS-MA-C1-2]|uniref:peptidoglycan DD-metalloendopeptidase family protein n=1 Tax=Vibrio sp. SS-MA-C1-2 TaxID=2908646 RepID=UPI001F488E50|nr:peptidoglycan DD-metalloendopeptidase family protein [Vibrio sp. SS-MA-C1-2]UJF17382.1 peptidoglycan DD-metalloendopeptidase family protein [Vibrio sp. SS-MA-C1-2]